MEKLALLVYPEFSLQEVMSLSRLFRWEYDICTEVISSDRKPIKSEEGILVLPQKTTDEFCIDDYVCLVFPRCSDFTAVFKDKQVFDFLSSLCEKTHFPIGAICSAPILLARAGILKGKKYTASVYMDLFDFCPFLEKTNYVAAPVVVSGNIITAGGSNFNGFAVEMAHLLGFDCPDRIFCGYMDTWKPEDYEGHLPSEAVNEVRDMFCCL